MDYDNLSSIIKYIFKFWQLSFFSKKKNNKNNTKLKKWHKRNETKQKKNVNNIFVMHLLPHDLKLLVRKKYFSGNKRFKKNSSSHVLIEKYLNYGVMEIKLNE